MQGKGRVWGFGASTLSVLLVLLVFAGLPAPVSAGDLWVGDYNRSGLRRYDEQTGAYLDTVGLETSPATGIAFGADGNAYVGGGNVHRIFRYERVDGSLTEAFVGNVSGELGRPAGLTFGPDGDIYATCPDRDNLLRFSGASGLLKAVFVADDGIHRYFSVTFGPDGHLYALHHGGVRRFNGTTGALIDEFAAGVGFSSPFDLTFGPDGHLYVSTGYTNRIAKYHGTTGAYIGDFVAAGSGGLTVARGITFGADGHLYVCSRNTGSVLKYNGTSGAYIGVFATGLSEPAFLRFAPDAPAPKVLRQIPIGGVLNGVRAHPGTRLGYAIDQGGGRLVEFDATTGVATRTVALAASPIRVAVDHLNDKLYVSHFGGNWVTVLRTSTFVTLKTITTANSGVEIDINPYTAKLYVANRGAASVSVIDTISDTVLKTIPTGSLPSGLMVDPIRNRCYVTIQGANQLLVIDGKTDTALPLITVGSWPAGVAMNPLTDRVYVANLGAGTISVIDANTLTVVKTIPAGAGPDLIAVNHLRNRFYVANSGEGTVSVFDGTSEVEVVRLPTGPTVVTVDVDLGTGLVYAANRGNGTVSVIEDPTFAPPTMPLPAAPEVTDEITVGNTPLNLAVAEATNLIFVGNAQGNSLSIVDGAQGTIVNTIPLSAGPSDVELDLGSGDAWVVTGFPYSLVRADANGVLGSWSLPPNSLPPFGFSVLPSHPGAALPATPIGGDSSRIWLFQGASFTSVTLPGGWYTHVLADPALGVAHALYLSRLDVVETSGHRFLGKITVPVPGSPGEIVRDADRRRVYIFAGAKVIEVDQVSASVVSVSSLPGTAASRGAALDRASGRLLITANGTTGDRVLLLWDSEARRSLLTLEVANANKVAVNPLTGRAYVTSSVSGSIGLLSVLSFPGPVSTDTGPDVEVEPQVALPGGETASVGMTFDNITSSGTTTVTAEVPAVAPPVGFRFGDSGVIYDVETTAEFTGTITLSFGWNEGDFEDEEDLRLFHGENGTWVDVTTVVDAVNNRIFGEVTSLSPFAIAEPEYAFTLNPPLDGDGAEIKAGRTIAVKFALEDQDGGIVANMEATLEVYRIGSEGDELVLTASSGKANDGNLFRYDADAGQYIYNLKTKGWTAGDYRLVIQPGDGTTREIVVTITD